MVTYFEAGVTYDVTIAFGHAQGDRADVLGGLVGYCSGFGCQGPTRGFLAASVLTAVVISITSIIAAEYTRSIPEWQQSERFITPRVGAT